MSKEQQIVLNELRDKVFTIEVVEGVEGPCLSINDYRVCGPKPWGGGRVAKSWKARGDDLLRAMYIEQKGTE